METADRLVIGCKALDLIVESDGVIRNQDDVERYMVRTSRTYWGDFYLMSLHGNTPNGKVSVSDCGVAIAQNKSHFIWVSCKTPHRMERKNCTQQLYLAGIFLAIRAVVAHGLCY